MINFGMEKYFDWELNDLHVSVGSFGPNFVFSGLNIENNLILDDWEL